MPILVNIGFILEICVTKWILLEIYLIHMRSIWNETPMLYKCRFYAGNIRNEMPKYSNEKKILANIQIGMTF